MGSVKIAVYGLCGMLSALAGPHRHIPLSSRPTAPAVWGTSWMPSPPWCWGGTSLMGGKGRIMGTLIGALIIGFLNNALNLLWTFQLPTR